MSTNTGSLTCNLKAQAEEALQASGDGFIEQSLHLNDCLKQAFFTSRTCAGGVGPEALAAQMAPSDIGVGKSDYAGKNDQNNDSDM